MNDNDKESFNYGFSLLRMFMCFEVIFSHFFLSNESHKMSIILFSKLTGIAVPVFMFLSFFLSKNLFLEADKAEIKKRLYRIIYPQIVWTFIYFFILSAFQLFFNKNFGVNIKSFFWQMFTGHSKSMNTAMWFQIDLILLTVLFILIFRFIEIKKGTILLLFLSTLSLFFQYTGINFYIFDKTRWEIRYPFGRLSEMIPFATLGFICAYYNLFERLKQKRLLTAILLIITSFFLLKYKIIPSAKGFGYSASNNLILAFSITCFSYILPFERTNKKVKNIIKQLTSNTLGIYCMHLLVGKFLSMFFSKFDFSTNNFSFCLTIYLSCYILCRFTVFFAKKISAKYLRQLVN